MSEWPSTCRGVLTAPQASLGRRRAVDRRAKGHPPPTQPQLLSRGARATASRRRASRRARIATGCGATSHPTLRGQLGPMPSNRAATAGAAASGASAESWPSGTYEALARGAVAAAASPGLEPPPPAGAGRGAAIDHVCSSRSPPVRGELVGWPPRARTRRRTCPADQGGLAEDTVRPASRRCRPIARSESGNEPSATLGTWERRS